MGEIYNPDHWFFKQRNGKKSIYLDKGLLDTVEAYAKRHNKCPVQITEYILRTGINTIEHNPSNRVFFDVDNV
jgi:hypothetical protein